MAAPLQTVNIVHNHACKHLACCLFIALQIAGERKAIASLFEVTNLFSCREDADIQANLHEKKIEYGILLQRSGLLKLTKDALEKQIADLKHKFDETSKVRIRPSIGRPPSFWGVLLCRQ